MLNGWNCVPESAKISSREIFRKAFPIMPAVRAVAVDAGTVAAAVPRLVRLRESVPLRG